MPVDYLVCILPLVVGLTLVIGLGALALRYRSAWRWLACAAVALVAFAAIYVLPGWQLRWKAAAGDLEAQYRLGRWYQQRYGNNFPNTAEALRWMSLAAANDHAAAQVWMGLQYQHGNSVSGVKIAPDANEAARWFIRAAANRSSPTAADLWIVGDPVEHLRDLAREGRIDVDVLLRAAAESGDAPSVLVLIEAGADASSTDEQGRSALDIAMDAGNASVVEALRSAIPPP